MIKTIREIIKFAGNVGTVNILKVNGSENSTSIVGLDEQRELVITINLANALPDLSGEFGFGYLPFLSKLIDMPNSQFSVIRGTHKGEEVPEAFTFEDAGGTTVNYRLMAKEATPTIGQFVGVDWKIELSPTKSKIAEFMSYASAFNSLGSQYDRFGISTSKGKLNLVLGDIDGSTSKGSVVFADGITEALSTTYKWPVQKFIQSLKLINDSAAIATNSAISFSEKAIKVDIKTEKATYEYLFVGKKAKKDN